MSPASSSAVSRAPRPSSLADVLDLILDKGLVIDAYVRVSLVGIELLTVDARVVVASVDTYLRFAEAVNRLDLRPTETEGLPGMFGEQRDSAGRPLSSGDGQGSRNGRNSGGGREREQSSSNRDEGEGRGRRMVERVAEKGAESLVGRLTERGRWKED